MNKVETHSSVMNGDEIGRLFAISPDFESLKSGVESVSGFTSNCTESPDRSKSIIYIQPHGSSLGLLMMGKPGEEDVDRITMISGPPAKIAGMLKAEGSISISGMAIRGNPMEINKLIANDQELQSIKRDVASNIELISGQQNVEDSPDLSI